MKINTITYNISSEMKIYNSPLFEYYYSNKRFIKEYITFIQSGIISVMILTMGLISVLLNI